MKQTYTFRLEQEIQERLKIMAKKEKQTMSEVLEKILLQNLNLTKEEALKYASIKGSQQKSDKIIDFVSDIQKQLYKWIIKDGKVDDYLVKEYLQYLKEKKEEIKILTLDKKTKDKIEYWIDKQMLCIQSRNWDNVDYDVEVRTDTLLKHLLMKKGLHGDKLRLVLDVINDKRTLTKRVTEELEVR